MDCSLNTKVFFKQKLFHRRGFIFHLSGYYTRLTTLIQNDGSYISRTVQQ